MQRQLFALVILGASLSLVGLAHAVAAPWKPIPLPRIEHGKVEMRVVYAENPRIEGLERDQIERLLAHSRRIARQHFNLDIVFKDYVTIPLDDLFDYLPDAARQKSLQQIYDFKSGAGNPARVRQALIESLRQESSLRDALEFARPYLVRPPHAETYGGLAGALLDTLLQRIEHWSQLQAKDGGSIIDQSAYNEYALWTLLGYGALPYDVIISNQPMISIEYTDLPLHTSLRGGITVGNTNFNKGSPLGTLALISTFAFTHDDDQLTLLRGGRVYSRQQAMDLAGAYLVHEIGHQLLHLGHPLSQRGCVMTPAQLLRFEQWYAALDPANCRLGSSPQMQVGAVSPLLKFNPAW